MSRTGIFIASLTGSVVALALVGQAMDFGDAFVAFALVLLPVVFFLGVVTIVRLSQVNFEDAVWVQGMNRIRNAYLELFTYQRSLVVRFPSPPEADRLRP